MDYLVIRRGVHTLIAAALFVFALGCSSRTQNTGLQHSLLFGHISGQHAIAQSVTRGPHIVFLPPGAQQALAGIAAPSLSASARGAKRASMVLPYQFPAEQPYSPGDAGYIASSPDVLFGGGATLAPVGAAYPDNFSYIIYRIDDPAPDPGQLQLFMGLTTPGSQLGVAAYNWAYGTSGRWEPLFYGDPTVNPVVNIVTGAGADYTDSNGDSAFCVFCTTPSQFNITGFELDPAPAPPSYDEVEPNDDDTTANALTMPVSAFTGNVGLGGTYNGGAQDTFSYPASVGDGVDFFATYDPGADWVAATNQGFFLALFDEEFILSGYQDPAHVWIGDGSGGIAEIQHTFAPGEDGPYYLIVVNVNDQGGPSTDYSLYGKGPETPYDEFEDNDGALADIFSDYDTSHVLNWFASLGTDPTYPGYDGDDTDVYAFGLTPNELSIGDSAQIHMAYTAPPGAFGMKLFDSSGTGIPLATSESGDGTEDFSYTVTGAETQPFFLKCYTLNAAAYGDYTLTGTR